MKTLLRLAGLLAVVATIVWLTRERLLPTPRIADEPPPHYRSTPPPPQSDPDDLTAIKGIGPVYAERLNEAGVLSFGDLAAIDSATIAETVGTSTATAQDWIAQAKAQLG